MGTPEGQILAYNPVTNEFRLVANDLSSNVYNYGDQGRTIEAQTGPTVTRGPGNWWQ